MDIPFWQSVKDTRMKERTKVQKAFEMLGPLYRELEDGVHTRRLCTICGLRLARGSKCYMCLIEGYVNEVGEM